MMSRPGARDLAITAAVCFIGGVGLTLLGVLIYYRVSRKKKLKERKRQEEEEEGSASVISNHVSEKRRDVFMQNSSNQTLDRKAMTLENHGAQFRSRAGEDGSDARCPDCPKGQRGVWPNQTRWNNGTNREEERDRMRMRMMMMMTEEERRNPGTQPGILSRDFPDKLSLSLGDSDSVPHPWREAFSERPETLTACKTDRNTDIHRTNVDGRSSGNETAHCQSCRRPYRAPQHAMRPGRIHGDTRDSLLFDGFPPQHRPTDGGRNYTQFDLMNHREFRRESRHVTFDLEQGEERGRSSRDREGGRKKRQKAKSQSPRRLKVKVSVSPLRKSKVHPTRKTEQGHLEKSSSRKSREKRKEKESEDGESKSGGKTRGSSKTTKTTTKSTEEENETKEDGEGADKTASPQNKAEDAAAGKEDDTNPDTPSAADQPAGTSLQYQEAKLLLTNAQLSSQHPFSLSAADRNRTANLSLQSSADSRLTGSSLSLQGGNVLLSPVAPGANAQFPSLQANAGAPFGVLNNRQTGLGLMPPAASLLASTVPASVLQNVPLRDSQAGRLSTNITNPAQSQLPPDSSPLVAGRQSGAVQGPGPQTVEGQAAQTKDSLPVQAQAPPQADASSGATPQAPGSETTALLPDTVGQTGTGGSAVGVSGDGTEAANVSGSGVAVPTQSGSSAAADGAAALLQQEYVSEEGGSSPRRKLRLVLPEKTSSRPPTALERKIR